MPGNPDCEVQHAAGVPGDLAHAGWLQETVSVLRFSPPFEGVFLFFKFKARWRLLFSVVSGQQGTSW